MQTNMTISQTAKYLRLTKLTLKRWDKQGKLVPKRIGERRDRVYTMDLINNFLSRSI